MRRVQLASALLRLFGLVLLAAAAWTVDLTAGLAASGLALLGMVYLPDGDNA